jgi:phosphoribosylformylglycinamidine synthase
MRASVIVFPGSNCDRDVKVALERVAGATVTMVWHQETTLPASDVIAVPGGFSYGDYLRCGAMAAHSAIMPDIKAKAAAGVPVLGICNGFQILTEAGLLPGVLMRNASLSFTCRDVLLKVERTDTPFSSAYRPGQVVRMPIAHAEGNYFTDAETLARLEGEGRVVFRYCDANGSRSPAANPNGAMAEIAGICSENRRVVALMPHPERIYEPALGGSDGAGVFRSLIQAAVAA